jgi:hypothetical protein
MHRLVRTGTPCQMAPLLGRLQSINAFSTAARLRDWRRALSEMTSADRGLVRPLARLGAAAAWRGPRNASENKPLFTVLRRLNLDCRLLFVGKRRRYFMMSGFSTTCQASDRPATFSERVWDAEVVRGTAPKTKPTKGHGTAKPTWHRKNDMAPQNRHGTAKRHAKDMAIASTTQNGTARIRNEQRRCAD